jgi:hypothetical protein
MELSDGYRSIRMSRHGCWQVLGSSILYQDPDVLSFPQSFLSHRSQIVKRRPCVSIVTDKFAPYAISFAFHEHSCISLYFFTAVWFVILEPWKWGCTFCRYSLTRLHRVTFQKKAFIWCRKCVRLCPLKPFTLSPYSLFVHPFEF